MPNKEIHKGIPAVQAADRSGWRKWLLKNHLKEKSVWLIIYHKQSKKKTIYYPEAVEEALCFGWIDSKPNKRDSESYYLYFAPRKIKSVWSKINKIRVTKLLDAGMMTPAGQAQIDMAMSNGSWDALNEIDAMVIPDDLKKAFARNKKALLNFASFPPSSKKIILHWVRSAKQEVTRKKRIKLAVSLAAKNIRANQYSR